MKKVWKAVLAAACVCLASGMIVGLEAHAEELQDEVAHDKIISMDEEGNVFEVEPEVGIVGDAPEDGTDEDGGTQEGEVEPYSNDNAKVVNFNTKGNAVTQYKDAESGKDGYTNGGCAADAAYLGTSKDKDGNEMVKFMLSGVTGLVPADEVEVVDVSKANCLSCYVVSSGWLVHRLSYNLNKSSWGGSLRNGRAPSYLQQGVKYYSYDGRYFYTDYKTMLEDYQAGGRANAVNASDAYNNYFQFLSMRTRSNYSAAELDQMLNRMITNFTNKDSKMLGLGSSLVSAQDTYGVNALIMAGIAANESAWGTSSIAQEKNNLFGLNAIDASPEESADTFKDVNTCIQQFADHWMNQGYLNPKDWRYFGEVLGNKGQGLNVKYASDPYWGEKAAAQAQNLDVQGGSRDEGGVMSSAPASMPFCDVRSTDWHYDSVKYVYDHGIMTGMDPALFGPAVELSRAHFVTLMYRMAGSPAVSYSAVYPDVPDGMFYSAAAVWAKDKGVMTGYDDGNFGAADVITREQMVTTMYRYAKVCGYDVSERSDLSDFPDKGNVSGFALEGMQWAVGTGLIQGDGGRINPQGTASRAQCATIITRFCKKYAE